MLNRAGNALGETGEVGVCMTRCIVPRQHVPLTNLIRELKVIWEAVRQSI